MATRSDIPSGPAVLNRPPGAVVLLGHSTPINRALKVPSHSREREREREKEREAGAMLTGRDWMTWNGSLSYIGRYKGLRGIGVSVSKG